MAELVIPALSLVCEAVMIYISYKQKETDHAVPVGLEEVETWLREMQAFLEEPSNRIAEGSYVLRDKVKQVQKQAYEIEDALDEFMLDVVRNQNNHGRQAWYMILHREPMKKALSKLSSRMQEVKKTRLTDLHEAIRPVTSFSSSTSSSQDPSGGGDDELVGFEMHEEKLLQQLASTDHSRVVILIAGPGGSGKTSLMNKIYRIHEVGGSVCDWVQLPNMPREEDEKRCLEPSVQGEEQFLVVLDNVLSRENLRLFEGNDKLGGSKIVITGRNSGVASHLFPRYIHDLSIGLSWENAKKLFCKKAFLDDQGNWPPELDDWPQKILSRCEGMPLAISEIGTFLFCKRKTSARDWKILHDSLGSELCQGESLSLIRRNLEPSYKQLRGHLRSCFLYFSMFPEGYNISRERLIRLWIAENFIKSERGGKTEKESAEDCINELVERNLAVATTETDGGRVRCCRVLNLVREINISRPESFITVLEADSQNTQIAGEKIRRLSAHNGIGKCDIDVVTVHSSRLRTLLMFGKASSNSVLQKLLRTSKYIRVLDLEGVPGLKQFPNVVVGLLLLKYLSLRKTQIKAIPKSIRKLLLLETLDLKLTKVTELPKEIKRLKRLRNLLVTSLNDPLQTQEGSKFSEYVGVPYSIQKHDASQRLEGAEVPKDVGDLPDSIQKLSLIKLTTTKVIKALGNLKDLKKLGLVDIEAEDGKELCNALEQMKDLLTLDLRAKDQKSLDLESLDSDPPLNLQHLYLRGSLKYLPEWISKLKSVRKIGLYRSNMEEDPLEVLEALPHLMELSLVGTYGWKELKFRGGKFQKLATLIIDHSYQLESLEVEDGALPMLRELNICSCSNMKSLPIGIGGLHSLHKLFLRDMPDELIAMLQVNSPHRHMVSNIPVIHSYKDGTSQDLS